ncbi:MAG: hypothetical protein AAF629_23185, partial [Chloroflexota bacterium]
ISVYAYLPARFIPIVIGSFLLIQAVLAKWQLSPVFLKHYWRHILSMAGVAFLIFLPLAIFFIVNPGTFGDRASAVSIFNPAVHQGDFWGLLWQTIGLTLGTFVSLTGDPNPFGNIPGLPQLNPMLAFCFLVGLVSTLINWRKPTSLFLFVWWPIMLLPGILAPEDAPHHLRLIGTAPATYIFVGLGLLHISQGLVKFVQPHRDTLITSSLIIIIFGITSFQTYRQYFITWATEFDHYMTYDLYIAELVETISAESDSNLTYVIPMDLRAAHEARHYSLDFLYQGEVPYTYLPVDEWTMAETLTTLTQDKDTLKIVHWTQDKHKAADEKLLVRFLLHQAGAILVQRETFTAYDIETYQLPSQLTSFTFPDIVQPIDVTLDNLIQIRRAIVSPTLTAANEVALGVTYARIAPTDINYKASVRLVGPDGGVITQNDRTLRHNWHQPTSLWPAEEVNEYDLLLVPPDAMAGLYEVRVVIYDPDTLAPLTESGLVEVLLGKVTIP